jgi:hypothetical protein
MRVALFCVGWVSLWMTTTSAQAQSTAPGAKLAIYEARGFDACEK